jgi:hypothetical protein
MLSYSRISHANPRHVQEENGWRSEGEEGRIAAGTGAVASKLLLHPPPPPCRLKVAASFVWRC